MCVMDQNGYFVVADESGFISIMGIKDHNGIPIAKKTDQGKACTAWIMTCHWNKKGFFLLGDKAGNATVVVVNELTNTYRVIDSFKITNSWIQTCEVYHGNKYIFGDKDGNLTLVKVVG